MFHDGRFPAGGLSILRRFVAASAITLAAFGAGCASHPQPAAPAAPAAHAGGHHDSVGADPDAALALLTAGNARYVSGRATHPAQDTERRTELAKGQHPFAAILCCSDSRVPPELVFDRGLGELFVIRVAGNIVTDAGTGSLEYAVEHFGLRLIVVMGHENCGAVAATLADAKDSPGVVSIVNAIKPAVEKAKGLPGDNMHNVVEANVKLAVEKLKATDPFLTKRVAAGQVKIVGARYELDTGKVVMLP